MFQRAPVNQRTDETQEPNGQVVTAYGPHIEQIRTPAAVDSPGSAP